MSLTFDRDFAGKPLCKNMKSITIIECPSNLGLKRPEQDREPGVRKLPEHLRRLGFYERLGADRVYRLEAPEYKGDIDVQSGVRNADAIVAYAQEQAALLRRVLEEDRFPVVLGGDCSILIGNALALREAGRFGLFFLDGHHDYMSPAESQTGGAAGMDLAIVTGYGHEKLTNILSRRPYFREEHVWCVGNREYDESYVELIRKTSIRYIDLFSFREMGAEACITGFLEMVTAEKLDGYLVHIDVDVLDDRVMPAVDSRQEGGLTFDEFNRLVRGVLRHPKAMGVEITILDPDLDVDGKFGKAFVENLSGIFR
jgi:arginase